MSLRIQDTTEAFNVHRRLMASSAAASTSMQRLSSGLRINGAADDAAGLAISERMKAQAGGLAVAQRNAQDAISLVQTADGALDEVHAMLQRLRDLKVQFNNGTLGSSDKDAIAAEVSQIAGEIGDITSGTKFNGKALFAGNAFTFQVGADDGDTISTSGAGFSSGIAAGGLSDITAVAGSAAAAKAALTSGGLSDIAALDGAIKNVSTVRGALGAIQNRLSYRLDSLATYQENLTAAQSRISDVDMAAEMTAYTKASILQQAGMSMLAQANQAPQAILTLLRG
jgi:flagellin